jgi:hypothetical protein
MLPAPSDSTLIRSAGTHGKCARTYIHTPHTHTHSYTHQPPLHTPNAPTSLYDIILAIHVYV